jgi:predicted transcriptional regulator
MDRLHQKGFISDPKSKAKSVLVTEEGQKAAKELFEKFFSS